MHPPNKLQLICLQFIRQPPNAEKKRDRERKKEPSHIPITLPVNSFQKFYPPKLP